MTDDDAENCGCGVCASNIPIAKMMLEQREAELARCWPPQEIIDKQVLELEAENQDLRNEVKELELEVAHLEQELSDMPIECPACRAALP